MTVAELIAALQEMPQEARVKTIWPNVGAVALGAALVGDSNSEVYVVVTE